ncbi:hypothetical protein M0813_01348 [Anaeramoeba flamelloides]|uniref:Uncharacterized protein n=1 Tax=Anaeramoeba flamelloides TaxID=1746091 RepID=A0ABQ8Z9B2_9EUKA|nr:hypothetical protein M0813_01348 [Anaeramoeba flamelloides]
MSTSDFEPFSTNSESDQLNMIGQNNTSSEEDTNSLNKPTVSDTGDVEKNKKKCCCIKSCSEIKLSGASIIGFFGIALGSFFIALHTFGDPILSLYFSIGLAVNNSTGKEVFKMGKPIIVTSNKCKKEEEH